MYSRDIIHIILNKIIIVLLFMSSILFVIEFQFLSNSYAQNKHIIQYHASGRAKSGSTEFACNAFYRLECPGKSIQEARNNCMDIARAMAENELLKDAKKRKHDAIILPKSIRIGF